MKTAKAAQIFVQATSEAEHMPATTTGDIMLFHHGQRSARKSTPTVNGVYPGSWTEDTEMSWDGTQHWDGVNLLKHHPKMVILRCWIVSSNGYVCVVREKGGANRTARTTNATCATMCSLQ